MTWTALQYDGCFDAFMKKAEVRVKAKTTAVVLKLKQRGDRATFPLVDKIEGYEHLYELRTTGKWRIRAVFFLVHSRKEIVFTSFHLKKSKKLPASVFEQAERVRKAYEDGSKRFTELH